MKYGDVDGDGYVKVADAQLICQFILHNITVTLMVMATSRSRTLN